MRKRREVAQPSDIAFALIIFFLLMMGAVTTKSLPISSAGGNQTGSPDAPAVITVHADGTLTEGEESTAVTLQDITPLLRRQGAVRLRVSSEARWQYVVDVLSHVQQQKISSMTIERLP